MRRSLEVEVKRSGLRGVFVPDPLRLSYIKTTLHSSAGLSQALASCTGTMFSGASCAEAVGIAIDPAGNVIFVRDQTVNMITPAGIVTTLAGTTGVYGASDGVGAVALFGTTLFATCGNAVVQVTNVP
jgi:hypothetical protein